MNNLDTNLSAFQKSNKRNIGKKRHSCALFKTISLCLFTCRFEYLFNFDNTFEIHNDSEVLKRMGMSFGLEAGKCSAEDLRTAKSLVPKALEGYITGKLE